MTTAYIVSARRTPVAPRGGALSTVEVADLASIAIRAALADCGLAAGRVDQVILGNALYGGGNPARVAGLAARLPEETAATTIDTQCCGGLDAVALARGLIVAGNADVVIAGGVESYSRAPIRKKRPMSRDEEPVAYESPPFTPWPDRDPDMLESAADLAMRLAITRSQQESYAVESHRRALADEALGEELTIIVNDVTRDAFTRRLTPALCARLPALAGADEFGLTAATTAVEADSAAVVVVVSERVLKDMRRPDRAVRILASQSRGCEPTRPALAPVGAARAVLERLDLEPGDIAVAEIMEAFAVQAIACIDGIGLDPSVVNPRGGALARGHPIGASGAILVVRLFHDLQRMPSGALALAAIAAAGGLGSAMVLRAEADR